MTNNNEQKRSGVMPSGPVLEAIAAISGVFLVIFTVLSEWVNAPTAAAIVVALVCGIAISAYYLFARRTRLVFIVMGWMLAAILVLVFVVVFPKDMMVEGSVINALSTPVPNVEVVLLDRGNRTYRAITDCNGSYAFSDVPCGQFKIESLNMSSISIETKGFLIRRQVINLIERSGPKPIATTTTIQSTPQAIGTPTVPITTSMTPSATVEMASMGVEQMAEPLSGTIRIAEKDNAVLLFVPSGSAYIGAITRDTMAQPGEKPAHQVELGAFWVDMFEVTNRQYRLCVDAGVCSLPDRTFYIERDQYLDHPVSYVDWDHAYAYCAWAGRRLLTEAEWERAARGDQEYLYPWGDSPVDGTNANFCDKSCTLEGNRNDLVDDGYQRTAPISQFAEGSSPFGARNMAGNVREWVADWYSDAYYGLPTAKDRDPKGPTSGTQRVVKGGSWAAIIPFLRVSGRQGFAPDMDVYASAMTGIRCGMDYNSPGSGE